MDVLCAGVDRVESGPFGLDESAESLLETDGALLDLLIGVGTITAAAWQP